MLLLFVCVRLCVRLTLLQVLLHKSRCQSLQGRTAAEVPSADASNVLHLPLADSSLPLLNATKGS